MGYYSSKIIKQYNTYINTKYGRIWLTIWFDMFGKLVEYRAEGGRHSDIGIDLNGLTEKQVFKHSRYILDDVLSLNVKYIVLNWEGIEVNEYGYRYIHEAVKAADNASIEARYYASKR